MPVTPREAIQRQLDRPGHRLLCPGVYIIRGRQAVFGLRHYTSDTWKSIDLWTIPGGRCESGETVGQALVRETAEETGITDLQFIDYLGEVPGAKEGDIVPLFVARTGQEPRLMEPQKFSEWRWCEPSGVPGAFINPAALDLVQGWIEEHGGVQP